MRGLCFIMNLKRAFFYPTLYPDICSRSAFTHYFMEISNNKQKFRFEAALPDGEFATLEYRWLKGNMVLMHTIVPPSAQGKGVGSQLIKYVLDYVREHNLKIVVYCSFVAAYVKEHPGYEDLVA